VGRPLILGQLDPDLACAIALGLVEHPRVVANQEAVTVHDACMRPLGTARNWLDPEDALDAATHDYLGARREAGLTTVPRPGQSAWGAASAARTRDLATRRAVQARQVGLRLLAERGTLAHARAAGLNVLAGY
jgi:hypothetical protein